MTEVTELEKLTAQVRYWEERATKTESRLQQTIERGRAHLESLSNQLAQAESRCNILQAELEKQPKALESKPIQSNELEEKLKASRGESASLRGRVARHPLQSRRSLSQRSQPRLVFSPQRRAKGDASARPRRGVARPALSALGVRRGSAPTLKSPRTIQHRAVLGAPRLAKTAGPTLGHA